MEWTCLAVLCTKTFAISLGFEPQAGYYHMCKTPRAIAHNEGMKISSPSPLIPTPLGEWGPVSSPEGTPPSPIPDPYFQASQSRDNPTNLATKISFFLHPYTQTHFQARCTKQFPIQNAIT